MSDWGATHDSVDAAKATLDMEMPAGVYYEHLPAEIAKGTVADDTVRQMALRVLTQMYRFGMFDADYPPRNGSLSANVTSDAHRALVRTLAAEATVVLRNDDDTLPLTAHAGMRVAVIGKQARKHVISAGGGSGGVVASHVAAPADAIQAVLDAANGTMVYVESDLRDAAAAAAAADVALVFVATTSAEGADRKTLALGNDQDDLVAAVAAVAKRTIVCVTVPGPVLLPWATHPNISAVTLQVMPGLDRPAEPPCPGASSPPTISHNLTHLPDMVCTSGDARPGDRPRD